MVAVHEAWLALVLTVLHTVQLVLVQKPSCAHVQVIKAICPD
jgi:hypothetical protein